MSTLRFLGARHLCRLLPPLFARKVSRIIYPYQVAKSDNIPFKVRSQTGSEYALTTRDSLGYGFALVGYNEWRLWSAALFFVPLGGSIVEVGANIGTETIGFSDIVGPEGRVVAIEPVPAAFRLLQSATSRAQNSNIAFLNCAISAASHRVTLICDPDYLSRSYIAELEPHSSHAIQVEAVPLDGLREFVRSPNMLVVDVEGWELEVVRGARRLIQDSCTEIVIEANPTRLSANGHSAHQLKIELEELGFTIRSIGRLNLKEPRVGNFLGYENWLCTRRPEQLADFQKFMRRCALTPVLPFVNPLTLPRRYS